MYLIDSDIMIFSLKADRLVAENFRAHRTDPIMISVVTYGELVFGARKSEQVERNLATALSHNLTLVTNNEKHFSRISGLAVVNRAA